MLSPKETYLVALISGAGATTVTATVKLQESVRNFESVTVHDTGVDPAGKFEPLDGEQTVDSGAVPPATVEGGNVTATGSPVTVTAIGPGHVIFGASIGVGGVDEPHPAVNRTAATHRKMGLLNGKARLIIAQRGTLRPNRQETGPLRPGAKTASRKPSGKIPLCAYLWLFSTV
jgi:hypothetical protein